MSDIDRIGQLLSTIRNAAAAKSERRPRTGPSSDRTPARSGGERTSGDTSVAALRTRIGRRLSHLDLDSADGRQSARRLFVESVLLWELGAGFADNPGFARAVAEVTAAFSDDAALRSEIDGVLRDIA